MQVSRSKEKPVCRKSAVEATKEEILKPANRQEASQGCREFRSAFQGFEVRILGFSVPGFVKSFLRGPILICRSSTLRGAGFGIQRFRV